MRAALGVVLAVIVVVLAAPAELVPPIAQWRAGVGFAGWQWSLLVAGVLALAALLLPPVPVRTHLAHATGLTVAVLLILEPGLHLLILAVSSQVATPAGAEALLPLAPPAMGPMFALSLLVYVVLVPIGEEWFFRGRLLPWLRQRLGAFSAVSLSAGFFAVAHGDLMQALVALPVGVLLGILRVQGAGLGACIAAHAVHNGLFLVAGTGLIGMPSVTPILVATGVVVATVTWFFQIRPRPGQWRRCVLTLAVAAALFAVVAPWWQTYQDRWWALGVHRLCVRWRIDTSDLLARVIAQERRGRMTADRQDHLVAALRARPCQTTFRQCGLLALLAPDQVNTIDGWEDGAHELLDHLAARPPARYDGELARRLGMVLPMAIADTILQWPEILPRWFPLPERASEAALLVASCTEFRDRRVLLTQLEMMFPGAVAAVIFAMPSAYLTPYEARHLRRYYADADQRLAQLATADRERAEALGWQP